MKLSQVLAFLFKLLIFSNPIYAQEINLGQISLTVEGGSLEFSELIFDSGYIKGSVYNNTKHDLIQAEIKIRCFDKNGNILKSPSKNYLSEESLDVFLVAAGRDVILQSKGTLKLNEYVFLGFLSDLRYSPRDIKKIAKIDFVLMSSVYRNFYDVYLVEPLISKDLIFDDDIILIKWLFDKNAMSFSLLNKTNESIKIDWNQISFVDVNGNAQKIIHQGIKYINLNDSQLPTIIPPKAKIQDSIVPVTTIQYSKTLNRWIEEQIFPDGIDGLSLKGASFRIFMPLELNGTIKNYSFTFNIIDVKQ